MLGFELNLEYELKIELVHEFILEYNLNLIKGFHCSNEVSLILVEDRKFSFQMP